ncbi:MAG TPA: hypothetical protein VFV34_09625, partial [Blastocatellia bacterium]|nr:hypothetical protein [Blastocatellia bacterium]
GRQASSFSTRPQARMTSVLSMNDTRLFGEPASPVKILFLGQCLHYGYQGVGRSVTFPAIAAEQLSARFPHRQIRFDLKYLYHPRGLKALLQHRLLLSSPDIVVISVPAMFAARHWRVSLLYQFAPEVFDTARSFLQKIENRVYRDCSRNLTALDKAFTVHPPIKLDEYENLIEQAVLYCLTKSTARPVLIGPGLFNVDTIEDYAIHSPGLWSAVNAMVLQLGNRLGIPVINAQDTLADHDGGVFIPNNHRWSERGHQIVALEVERVLAPEISALGAARTVTSPILT